jgi:hypothetical protein
MNNLFEICSGSVIGQQHILYKKNNQDNYNIYFCKDMIVCVVCDGCGSGKYSEVGSSIGSNLVCSILSFIHGNVSCTENWIKMILETSRLQILYYIDNLINVIKPSQSSYSKFVQDYFLFTIVGAIIRRDLSAFFSIGDGIIIINNNIIQIGPFLGNAPPYITYDLDNINVEQSLKDLSKFQIHQIIPTNEIDNFLIGTDGMFDFISSENRNVPGRIDIVGPVSQFWTDDKYYKNSDMVRRKLAIINNDKSIIDNKRIIKLPGLLPDDTTLISGRKILGDNHD